MICGLILSSVLLVGSSADAPSPSEADRKAYEAAQAGVGRDPAANVRLALWCEAHGMMAERLKHLEIGLEADPDHAAARGLLGQVADGGAWRKPEEVAERARGDADLAATLAHYNERREKIPDTAEAHWQLAKWCAQNGLEAEAVAHLMAVVRLDPAREQAWKRLGFHKQNGRWTTPEQLAPERAEAEAQRKADAHWGPLLQKWRTWLGQKNKRPEAETALAGVVDPRATPSIWRIFAQGGSADQTRAVQQLGQIDAPAASRGLALMAVLADSADIRRAAAQTLAGRDPREFAALLIAMLRDPIKYEVRAVGGPGTPGELYVEGKRLNVRRFYSAPPPLTTLRPGDVLGFDENGLPVANRVVGWGMMPTSALFNPLSMGVADMTGLPEQLARDGLGDAGRQVGQRVVQSQKNSPRVGQALPFGGIGGGFIPVPIQGQIPVGELVIQAQQQAAFSRQRLENDIAALERHNEHTNQVNDRASLALVAATGQDLGTEPSAWRKWLSAQGSSSAASPRSQSDERKVLSREDAAGERVQFASLAAGTRVWTRLGLRPVEDLRAGDRVLTQDTTTGALRFDPVLTIRRASAAQLKSIEIADESILTTELERLWLSGKAG